MRRRESRTNITALNPEPNTVAADLGAVAESPSLFLFLAKIEKVEMAGRRKE
jgi:hypothetical protein